MPDKENQNPSPQDVLFEQVWLPAFAEKCAEHGIPCSNEEELAIAVENALMAKQALETANSKHASEMHKFANEQLRALLGTPEGDDDESEKEAEDLSNLSEDVIKALKALQEAKPE